MPPYQGSVPDRFGDWGLECLTTQDKQRREVSGVIVKSRPAPPVFRPPEDFGGCALQRPESARGRGRRADPSPRGHADSERERCAYKCVICVAA